MKDGSAHPTDLTKVLYFDGGSEEWRKLPAHLVHEITFHDHDDTQRAAVDLERIAKRYSTNLPSPTSADSRELRLAAFCLVMELYRDCGTEARRQKLEGARLLQRWIEKTTRPPAIATTEAKQRARAFMVADVVDLGITDHREAAKLAAAVATRRGQELGKLKSFIDAHKAYLSGPDWLTSGLSGEIEPYEPVTAEDIEDLSRKPSKRQTEAMHHHLAEAAKAMPRYWRIADCVKQAQRKAHYMRQRWDDENEFLADSLCQSSQPWQRHLFDAIKTGAPLPGSGRLRNVFSAARKSANSD